MSFHPEKKESDICGKLHNQISVSEKIIQKVSVQEGMIYNTIVFLKFFATEFA